MALSDMMRHEMPLSSDAARPIHERLACAVADLIRVEFSPMSVLVTITHVITGKIAATAVAAWSVPVPECAPAITNLGVFRG